MAERYYVNCPLTPGPITLRGPEAHHLATVCRLRRGDPVCLFNGDGRQYPAVIVAVGRRSIDLQVQSIEAPHRELGFRLEVAAPLPKGDRAQFLMEKLTELGASAFIPLKTARSVVHPRDTGLDKLQRYVIEASKQCGRNVLLHVEPLITWQEHCQRGNLPEVRILAHPGATAESWQARQDCALAVGPEGGFTEEEVALATLAGWRPVNLGPRILRVETAALFMAALSANRPERGDERRGLSPPHGRRG
jgi:16S rRNA (uracil1498-N3)-methyltransferase